MSKYYKIYNNFFLVNILNHFYKKNNIKIEKKKINVIYRNRVKRVFNKILNIHLRCFFIKNRHVLFILKRNLRYKYTLDIERNFLFIVHKYISK